MLLQPALVGHETQKFRRYPGFAGRQMVHAEKPSFALSCGDRSVHAAAYNGRSGRRQAAGGAHSHHWFCALSQPTCARIHRKDKPTFNSTHMNNFCITTEPCASMDTGISAIPSQNDCADSHHAGGPTNVLSTPAAPKRSTTIAEVPYIKPDSTHSWKKCLEIMEEHDKLMLNGWKDELNNLLIFVRSCARWQ